MKAQNEAEEALSAELMERCQKLINFPVEVAAYQCGDEKTLQPIGSAQVQNLVNVTEAEFIALLRSLVNRIITLTTTFCNRAAPNGCKDVEIIDITNPSITANPSPNGQPPFTVFLQVDVKFRCVRRV